VLFRSLLLERGVLNEGQLELSQPVEKEPLLLVHTADYVRASGGRPLQTRWVAGVRFWF
jgi:hypothetical protein